MIVLIHDSQQNGMQAHVCRDEAAFEARVAAALYGEGESLDPDRHLAALSAAGMLRDARELATEDGSLMRFDVAGALAFLLDQQRTQQEEAARTLHRVATTKMATLLEKMEEAAAKAYEAVNGPPLTACGDPIFLLTPASLAVMLERRRHITEEGWTAEHDDLTHDGGCLAYAAACYALAYRSDPRDPSPPAWPWDEEWWKPSDPRQNLVKAGALILAEIERLDREDMRAAAGPADRPGR